MPKGIPVATMALGRHGGSNAALLAVEILALNDEALRMKLVTYRAKMADKVEAASLKIKEKL
jgi:5-(carboxyamino)imidazole ribonucleotide mutase